MDATAVPIVWKRNLWQGAVLAAFGAFCYGVPPVAPFLSLLLPLFVCPAYAHGERWFAFLMPLVAAFAFLLRSGDTFIGLLIPLCSCLCLLMSAVGKRRQWGLHARAAAYAAAFTAAALTMLSRLGMLLGGPLFSSLAETAVGTLQSSASSGNILYQLTSLGVLAIPDAYAGSKAFRLGNLVLMDPGLAKELLNMLRLRLSEGLTSWIPSLMMHGAVLTGVFTTLFAARTSARKADGSLVAPRFRDFRLTRTEQGYTLLLCVATLLTGFSGDAFLSQFSTLTYTAFAAVYQLLGAAVFITLLTLKHPTRTGLYGILAGLLYVVFPIALFLLGMFDQFLPLRPETPNHQEEE